MRLARTAARDGIYAPQAAPLVLIPGWWLLAGGLVAIVAEAFARLNLLGQLVTWHVDRGMTLTELSERVGVSVVNLSILKNGHARAIRLVCPVRGGRLCSRRRWPSWRAGPPGKPGTGPARRPAARMSFR